MFSNKTIIGEDIAKRTANTKHYRIADGSYQAVIFSGQVHYADQHGNLHNIETALTDEAELDQYEFPVAVEAVYMFERKRELVRGFKAAGTLDRDRLWFQGLRVPYAPKIGRNWSDGYSVGYDGQRLGFVPVGASPSWGYIDKKNRSSIKYQDAWNDTDAVLHVTAKGLKEDIILKTDRAPSAFSFEVTGDLADDFSCGALQIEPAWLEDANGERRDVAQTVRKDKEGRVFLDLVADVEGLVYPVIIDPTIVYDAAAGIVDTYTSPSSPSSNYGNAATFAAGAAFRTLMKFDLSTVPAGASILRATLYVVQTSTNTTSTSQGTTAFLCTSSWTETGVTYNTMPTIDTTKTCDFLSNMAGSGISENNIDMTAFVRLWTSGTPNYGLLAYSEYNAGAYANYASTEYTANTAYRPTLTVIYAMPPSAATVTYPNGGETINAQHTITWTAPVAPAGGYAKVVSYHSYTSSTSTSIAGGTTSTVGQVVRTTNASSGGAYPIAKISFTTDSAVVAGRKLSVYGYDSTAGTPNKSVVYASNVPIPATAAAGLVEVTLPNPITVGAYSYFYIELDSAPGFKIKGQSTGSTSYPFFVGGVKSTAGLMAFQLEHGVGDVNSYGYQIDLSTNGGSTWKTITTTTQPGATSFPYNFINETESSNCKIRIRAYDGAAYGPYDVSDGVFTIVHAIAPLAPTNLAPAGGSVVDRASVVRLSWKKNDPNTNDPQAKFTLRWRVQGTTTWNTVTQTTINEWYDAPNNMFPRGFIEWQVCTSDQTNLTGPYSSQAVFFAGDKPAAAILIAPGPVVSVSRPTVQWSSPDQVFFQAQVLNMSNATIWDSTATESTNKAVSVGVDLSNGLSCKIRVRIKNAEGLWSDWTTIGVTISYTPPAKASVELRPLDGHLHIVIINPEPAGTQPLVSGNDLMRREATRDAQWIRVSTGLQNNGVFSDYAVKSGTSYEYKAVTFGDNGTVSESDAEVGSVELAGIWLHDVADPKGTAHRFATFVDRKASWSREAVFTQYEGRDLPCVEYGTSESSRVSAKLQLTSKEDLERFKQFARTTVVCYRDARGRKAFGVIVSVPEDDMFYGSTVQMDFQAIAFIEGV